jgi:hypothetical protein
MYFDRKIFPLSRTQIEEIKETKESGAMMKILERLSRTEEPVVKTARKLAQASSAVFPNSSGSSSEHHHFREKYITDDDITNLRIELALCQNSADFIKSL